MEDARGAESGELSLLSSDPAFLEEYIEACLMDLQNALDSAWESGEIGPANEQLMSPLAA
jgi:hypothetical protein